MILCLNWAKASHSSPARCAIVRYSILQENQQLFASKYQRILPTEAELIAELERERRLIEGEMVVCDLMLRWFWKGVV
ncbi:hypothetical protein D5085_07585 [Ectothiorhodospiraceae bacterium BW-2]|nr:hypothetical protein D5085_07585 [Ectothiorhodospiraceae bacterium BW-2]